MKKWKSNFFSKGWCNIQIFIVIMAPTIFTVIGCSHTEKVLLPPKVELQAYRSIGVIEFSTNAEDTLKPYLTQNFIEYVQSAQPGTRIFEMGDKNRLLGSIGHSELDPTTIQSIGKKYNVDALILGHFEVSEIRPKINIHTATGMLNANAYIEASLVTRIFETNSGVTIWTRATSGKTRVAKISVMEEGSFSIGVHDPSEKYGKLIPELVYANTSDFRSYYEYRTVK